MYTLKSILYVYTLYVEYRNTPTHAITHMCRSDKIYSQGNMGRHNTCSPHIQAHKKIHINILARTRRKTQAQKKPSIRTPLNKKHKCTQRKHTNCKTKGVNRDKHKKTFKIVSRTIGKQIELERDGKEEKVRKGDRQRREWGKGRLLE